MDVPCPYLFTKMDFDYFMISCTDYDKSDFLFPFWGNRTAISIHEDCFEFGKIP